MSYLLSKSDPWGREGEFPFWSKKTPIITGNPLFSTSKFSLPIVIYETTYQVHRFIADGSWPISSFSVVGNASYLLQHPYSFDLAGRIVNQGVYQEGLQFVCLDHGFRFT